MTTPTTPYALWRNMPLSDCRAMWLERNQFATPWATRITVMWLMRECEAQRDQLAAVTAERDALRRDYNDLLAERDALQFAATQAARERDGLQLQLNAIENGGA